MEGIEEVGADISDFGSGGSVIQDTRDIFQGGGPSSDIVHIRYMGHDPIHWYNYRGIS